MEDDESKQPQSVTIPQQQVNVGQQQMYGQQMYGGQPQQIFITNNTTSVVQLLGFHYLIRFLSDVLPHILFSEWQADQSFIAMTIGVSYVFGGILSVQGYREGLQLTLVTLLISGIFSFIYNDEFGPLSIGMGGIWPVEMSLICSGFCMLVVALPLLTADPSNFRDGSPKYLRSLIDTADWFSPIPLLGEVERR